MPNGYSEDVAGSIALRHARAIRGTEVPCATCNADTGQVCTDGGRPRAVSHQRRREHALEEALARALMWLDEMQGVAALARTHRDNPRFQLPHLVSELDRVLAPAVPDYLRGIA